MKWMKVKNLMLAAAVLLTGVKAHASEEINRNIFVNAFINQSRLVVEFTIQNLNTKDVLCNFISIKANYVDTANNLDLGFRSVLVRNITINKDSNLAIPENGRDIIKQLQLTNPSAQIKSLNDNDIRYDCDVKPDPVVIPPVDTPVVIPPTTSPSPSIQDGHVYMLTSRNSKRCFDLKDHNLNNGATYQQWDCQDGNQQKYRFKDAGNGYFTVVNLMANKCISVKDSQMQDGATMHSWDCVGSTNQKIKLTKNNFAGSWSLRFEHSNKCADVYGKEKDNGLLIHQWTCNNDAPDQAWDFKDVTSGSTPDPIDTGWESLPFPSGSIFSLRSKNSAKCLDLQDWGLVSGTTYQQWECDGQDKQRFRFDYVGGGYFTMINLYANKCVSIVAGKSDDGANLHSWECLGNPDQLVKFTRNKFEGTYSVRFKHSNKCADVYGKGTESGLVVHQWQCVDDAPDQAWFLEE